MWAAIPLYRRHGRTAKPQAPTVRHPALLLLVLMMLAATASGAGQPSCPCLANQPQSLNSDGTIDMTLAGITHKYPGSYGVSSCSAHDAGLQPYCAANPPQFCSQNWCYVNPANCNLTSAASTYFSGSYYSYQTCGEANTWSQWFSASSSGSHAITDLADVMKGYLQTISGSVEENYAEVAGSSSASCSLPGACTCSSCAQDTNSVWGTQSIDGTKSTFWERPGTDNAEALRLDQCLATFIGDQFTKIATKESDPNRLGYEYHGSQENGNYVQWPGTDWCPTDYDPRFRPWYAAAASGPKDVVIVLVSAITAWRARALSLSLCRSVHRLTHLVDSTTGHFRLYEWKPCPNGSRRRQGRAQYSNRRRLRDNRDIQQPGVFLLNHASPSNGQQRRCYGELDRQ